MSLRQTLAVLAILLTAGSAVPTSSSTTETSSTFPHLNELAQAKGKLWFGSSIDTTSDSVDDETYMSIFNKYEIFGQTTPGNTMKWQYTEPENGEFDFSLGEETVTLAKKSDKKIRCHNLVWTSQLPSWVSDGSWTKETLLEVMKTHITKEITYYGSNCYSWDVVNEAIEYDGSYTDNVFLDVIGEDYVTYAFQYARETVNSLGADIKLFYNDYTISRPGTKVTAVLDMIAKIQSAGDYIDGIGMESHHTDTYYPTVTELTTVMDDYADKGLEIHITELDVACKSTPCSWSGQVGQAQAFYNVIHACMEHQSCTGMTFWDFNDKYNWIQPSTNDGEGDATVLWGTYAPKPALTAVVDALKGESCSVC
ncbi:CAZyme family GH10 [Aspergillus niger]|uniref:Beta-xylanase n=1 Tax=Aspergillus niger ATCC 13496 TaxID=1353008 RepID=A0A370C9Q4_ASPNG|nr:putative endo-1,4-beta-xylanase [Aspergillus niger CBS 101883]KAI2814232.1 CAZyme family GH10 [Aspergillus niger]RDH24494.1 putative endo-1,4-beta-xylanase [Aspergillus niger ATCC 13496]KAI2836972.1 CAZyme family GH10 [Aspergillus niger]KAI2837957.1 CAZyme family GH10 [Aspergillus niger]KAI2861337.1 CAZyme family GH10 [Aspergillus niger]